MDRMDETLKKIAQSKAPFNTDLYDQVQAYFGGDNYQDGKGWSGPVLTKLKTELERIFVGDPVLATAAKRAVLAVVGREPTWEFVPKRKLKLVTVKDAQTGEKIQELEKPTAAEEEQIRLANELCTNYWDQNRLARMLIRVTSQLVLHDQAFVRMYFLQDGEIKFKNIEEAMDVINVHIPRPGDAHELEDEHGRIRGVEFVTRGRDERIIREISWYDYVGKVVVTELVDDNYDPINPQDVEGEVIMKLKVGNRLPIYRMREAGLVTKTIVTIQMALDHDFTMLTKNNTLAGFRERVMLNAMEPTEVVVDPRTGKETEVMVPMKLEAGTTAWIKGIPLEDPNSGDVTGYANPQVLYKDPVDQSGLLASIDHKIRRILEAMFQAHVLISGDATASGTSRQQAVQDHVASLELIKREVEAMLRWLFELLLATAANLVKKPDMFKDIRCAVTARVSAIQLTSQERAQLVNEYNARLRSQEKTMSLLGEDDPEAERAAIDRDQLTQVKEEVRKQKLLPGEDPGTKK